MNILCDELVVTTDDGSYGQRGFVTQPLEKYLEERHDIKLVYAIGPIIMMKNELSNLFAVLNHVVSRKHCRRLELDEIKTNSKTSNYPSLN